MTSGIPTGALGFIVNCTTSSVTSLTPALACSEMGIRKWDCWLNPTLSRPFLLHGTVVRIRT